MDIKQRLQQETDSMEQFGNAGSDLALLCRDARTEIERLERLAFPGSNPGAAVGCSQKSAGSGPGGLTTPPTRQLCTDPARESPGLREYTGIYVRALKVSTGGPASVDICELDRASLQTWLTSRGGSNEWAESVVLVLLGHEVPP